MLFLVAGILAPTPALTAAPTLGWTLVAEHPRAPDDFTQGLVWSEGRLFESAGHYGASRVVEKRLADGRVRRATAQPAREFGEGLARVGDLLWQFTWREGVVNAYDLQLRRRHGYCIGPEVWGAASDGASLVLSNGSSTLVWAEPAPFNVTKRLSVTDDGTPVDRLNELEWIDGVVYANVWMTDRIARIDTTTGAVTGWLDLAPLKALAAITAPREAQGAVLNGIAWRPETGTLLVTGKWWPKVFEIKLLPTP